MGSSSRSAAIEFYKNVVESSSKEDSDGETEILFAAASLVHTQCLMPAKRDGSSKRRQANVDRDQESGHVRLYKDYFHQSNPVFKAKAFRRRYRMSRELFLRILNGVRDYDDYFQAKPDCTGKVGFSSYQKCSAAVRQLADGVPGDLLDDYFRISESTCIESMYRFCNAVIAVFGDVYTREPTAEDIARLLSINESRGFPGMLGSIDCMHWQWKNCPFAWQGQFQGYADGCTVILEAVASQDLWIWHSFFGMAGSNNDINVFQRSPVFARLADGNAPILSYEINGNPYDMGYYLADGIYPSWATFVKTIRNPGDEKYRWFAKEQEAARKDVERSFGVLQSCWAIVRYPSRTWSTERMWSVMIACVIMHNMIVEVERDDSIYDQGCDFQGELAEPEPGQSSWEDFMATHHNLRDRLTHDRLQQDLIEHMWAHVGNH